MTKVVNYLFDNMFQGKQKISLTEKIVVVSATLLIVSATLIIVL